MINSNYRTNMPHYDSTPFNCNPEAYMYGMPSYGDTSAYTGAMSSMPRNIMPTMPGNIAPTMPGNIMPTMPGNITPTMPGSMMPSMPGGFMPGVPFIPETEMPFMPNGDTPAMPMMPRNSTMPYMPEDINIYPGIPGFPQMPQTPTMRGMPSTPNTDAPSMPNMSMPQNGMPMQITCEQLMEMMRRMNCSMDDNTTNTDSGKSNNKQNKTKR